MGDGSVNTTATDRFAVLKEWQAAAVQSKEAIERERNLRTQVVALFFADQDKEGTKYASLLNGWRLKTEFKFNYKIDSDAAHNVVNALRAKGEAGAHAADKIFRYKPELALSIYKTLPPSFRELVDEAVTTSEGSAVVSLVPPK